jgi:formiminotetrahydrofolate cyclodeaminase
VSIKVTDYRLTDLLAAFQSPAPTPGGGSAAALAGAVGASLLAMVAGLPKPRAATAENLARLAADGAACVALSERLTALIDRDTEAYRLVVAGFRMPKGTDDEKAVRGARVQEALRMATETPLDVMRACADAIGRAAPVAAFANPHAASDVQVGLELLGAGLRGARLNVEVNLESLKDGQFVTAMRDEAARLTLAAEAGIEAAHRAAAEPTDPASRIPAGESPSGEVT